MVICSSMAAGKIPEFPEAKYRFEEIIPHKRTRLSRKYPERDLLQRQLHLCVPDVALEAGTEIDDKVMSNIGRVLKREGREVAGRAVRQFITEAAKPLIYPEVGSNVLITKNDLLLTTPLDKTEDAAEEADELKALYKDSEEIGYYYRLYNPWGAPKTLGIGSKLFYVDRRAVRGFAVVTDFSPHRTNAIVTMMAADTWKWIDPIPCDYDRIKPPQGYAYADRHKYLENVHIVDVVGGWLDPMPEK